MTSRNWVKLAGILSILAICPAGWASGRAGESVAESLQGDQGTVEKMKGNQVQNKTGENQPRIISLRNSGMQGTSEMQVGDLIDLTFNLSGAVVGYHIVNAVSLTEGSDDHLILKGHIADPFVNSHRTALIRTDDGKELSLDVRPEVRSKMSALPVGIDAVFMLDETNRIVDVNFASEEAAQRAGLAFDDKAPLPVAYQNVLGTIVKTLDNNRIIIRTDDGAEQEFEVRVSMRDKIAGLPNGQSVVLMLDETHKVADMAVTPTP